MNIVKQAGNPKEKKTQSCKSEQLEKISVSAKIVKMFAGGSGNPGVFIRVIAVRGMGVRENFRGGGLGGVGLLCSF